MARQALAFGRRRVAGFSLLLPGGGGAVAPVLRVDAAALAAGLKPIAKAADMAPRDATLRCAPARSPWYPRATAPPSTRRRSAAAVRAAVLAAKPYSGAVPLHPAPAQVTRRRPSRRAAAAAAYLQAPLTLRCRGRERHLCAAPPGGHALRHTRQRRRKTSRSPSTTRTARAVLHGLFAVSRRRPWTPPSRRLAKGGIRDQPEQRRPGLDMTALVSDMDHAAAAPGLRTVYVALRDVAPQLSTDDVQTSGLATAWARSSSPTSTRATRRACAEHRAGGEASSTAR